MTAFILNIFTMIFGGSGNLVTKLISSIGVGIIWKWLRGEQATQEKKMDDAKLDIDINKSTAEAGRNAANAKDQAELNEEYLKQKRMINELKLKAQVKITVPDEIKVGEAFDVKFEGIEPGTVVMMDSKWKMGNINSQGYLKIILNTAGKRVLSVEAGPHSFKKAIEVKMLTPTP